MPTDLDKPCPRCGAIGGYSCYECTPAMTTEPITTETLDEVERAHGGYVWSVVRGGLARQRERLIQAFDSGNYEMESNRLDAVAREITADIEPMIEKYAALARLREERRK